MLNSNNQAINLKIYLLFMNQKVKQSDGFYISRLDLTLYEFYLL